MSTFQTHKKEDLLQMQALPLQAKIKLSKERIKEWYDHYDGNVYVSFSGGKDSTVLLHIVRSLYPDVKAVFSDTGLEFPEIRTFVKNTNNVTWIKPKMTFKQVVLKYGYPAVTKEVSEKIYYARAGRPWAQKFINGEAKEANGKPSRYRVSKRWLKLLDAPFQVNSYCCKVLKKQVSDKYERESGEKAFLGTLAAESKIRTQAWQRTGCNAFEASRPHSTPLAFWTENDILRYIVENNIEICSVYGDVVETGNIINGAFESYKEYKTTGYDRTGCMFCMFGCHLEPEPNRFQKMKKTHPAQYNYCMKPVDEGGLGLDEVLTFLDINH